MDEATRTQLQEVFCFLDRDGNGFVSDEEVDYLMRLLGLDSNEEERKQLIAEVDPDHDGNLSFSEFVQVMSGYHQMPYSNEDVNRAFRMFVETGSPKDFISKSALKQALTPLIVKGVLEEADLDRLIQQFSNSLDGWVEYRRKVDFQLPKY